MENEIEQVILSDVPRSMAEKVVKCMSDYFRQDFKVVYNIGANNPDIVSVGVSEIGHGKLAKMTTFAIGCVWGVTEGRGF